MLLVIEIKYYSSSFIVNHALLNQVRAFKNIVVTVSNFYLQIVLSSLLYYNLQLYYFCCCRKYFNILLVDTIDNISQYFTHAFTNFAYNGFV